MNAIDSVLDRENRPAYVKFERVAVENKSASLEAGHYVAMDVDMANITPPFSKDIFKIKVKNWFNQLAVDEQNGRIPPEWVKSYKEKYAAWQQGQELPLDGTPIKGWGVISPAQQETLIAMHVLTVEDLALMNDEGVKRVGMGGLDLKSKAKAWLAQLIDKGALTIQMASLESENRILKTNQAALEKRIDNLINEVKNAQNYVPTENAMDIGSSSVAIGDVLEDDEPQEVVVKRKTKDPL